MNTIVVFTRKIVMGLVIAGIILVILSVAGHFVQYLTEYSGVQGIINMFSLGLERNIPTYFTAVLCLFSSLLLLIITMLHKKQGGKNVTKWALLSGGFLFISIDEIVMLHERLINPVSSLLGGENLGIFTFAWVIPGIILVLSLAIYFFSFFLHLDLKTRLNFIMAATLYIGGAIGFELIGGRYYGLHGADNLTYRMLQNIEESLEIAGLIVFISGLLQYIQAQFENVHLIFTISKSPS